MKNHKPVAECILSQPLVLELEMAELYIFFAMFLRQGHMVVSHELTMQFRMTLNYALSASTWRHALHTCLHEGGD